MHLNNTSIKAIAGSMVAYEGNVAFQSSGFGGGSGLICKGIKQRATDKTVSLMECLGHGAESGGARF